MNRGLLCPEGERAQGAASAQSVCILSIVWIISEGLWGSDRILFIVWTTTNEELLAQKRGKESEWFYAVRRTLFHFSEGVSYQSHRYVHMEGA